MLLLTMCIKQQLSGLLVCLGRTCSVFSVPRGTEKIAGLWFARTAQYSGWHYAKSDHFKYSKTSKFSLSTMVANTKPSFQKCLASYPSGTTGCKLMIRWSYKNH